MNIWKIGSRWSDGGNTGSSILNLFRKYNLAFVHSEEARNKIKKDDLIALSDEYKKPNKKIKKGDALLQSPFFCFFFAKV